MTESAATRPPEALTWAQIRENYEGRWVLMLDVDWPDDEVYPRSGVVVAVATSPKETLGRAKELPIGSHFTHLFIRPPRKPEA